MTLLPIAVIATYNFGSVYIHSEKVDNVIHNDVGFQLNGKLV